MPNGNIERLRESFKPKEIKVLMIAESPPFSGNFFYRGDDFAQFTHRAFVKVCEPVKGLTTDEFLHYFRNRGFYLEDLCHTPVNRMNDNDRRAERERGVEALCKKIRRWRPRAIICCMKEINEYVLRSIELSELDRFYYFLLPYPRQKHIASYISGLENVLHELKRIKKFLRC